MVEPFRNRHAGQRPREGLFLDMRMGQFPIAELCAIRRKDFPAAGIVVPAGVGMGKRYGNEPVRALMDGLGGDNLRCVSISWQGGEGGKKK